MFNNPPQAVAVPEAVPMLSNPPLTDRETDCADGARIIPTSSGSSSSSSSGLSSEVIEILEFDEIPGSSQSQLVDLKISHVNTRRRKKLQKPKK